MGNKESNEVFIRSDGWVFTKEGMSRLKEGGMNGFNTMMKNTEAKIGKWRQELKPMDSDVADILKGVKGMIERAKFITSALLAEESRRSKKNCGNDTYRTKQKDVGKFMRLTITDDAKSVVGKMSNKEFREFFSEAILRAAKKA